MPVALISTRTSPAFGPSRSSSTISSGFFASNATAARVFMVEILSRFSSGSANALCPCRSFQPVGIGRGLVLVFRRPPARHRIIGASPQVDVEVVHVAGHVRIIAEGRHDVLLRGVDVLAAARDDAEEVAVTHRLQRILQRRRVARSHAVGPVANVAVRVITAESGIGVPIDGAVGLQSCRSGYPLYRDICRLRISPRPDRREPSAKATPPAAISMAAAVKRKIVRKSLSSAVDVTSSGA